MALPRLRSIVRSYVLDSLREQDEFNPERNRPNESLLDAPSTSKGVRKVYIHHNALTIFSGKKEYEDHFFGSISNIDHCFTKGFRFVHRDDNDHDAAHQSAADFNEQHTHILRNQFGPHPLLTPDNLKCILEDIKVYERENGFCKDGKTTCILSDADQKKIEENFAEYIRVKKSKMPNIEIAADAICEELESRCRFGAKTFAHIFLTTLLDKYIKPYLIDKYNDPKKVLWMIEIIKTGITFSLVKSLSNAALSFVISNGLRAALTARQFDPEYIDIIVNRVSAVLAFTENPLSLVDIGINDTAAEAGQNAAYAVIRSLPKLRVEPEAAAVVVAPAEQNQLAILRTTPGLRRRNSGLQ